ncbi:hypothetical protein BKI52_11390 [marine bacterium AO1-C]|nr:hypothetical protein BKI52_11390 [marine bacterium AO1-C]
MYIFVKQNSHKDIKMKSTTIRGYAWKYEDVNPQQQETILMVHGHPFDHTMWKYQHEALKDFRLILPDLKGYGQTTETFEKIFIEEQALDLALLLDALQISKVHLVGLSMGGQIIVEFQRLFSHRVKSLMICASTPNAETPQSSENRLKLAEYIEQIGMLCYTQEDIHKYINVAEVGQHSEVYEHLFQMMSKTNAQNAIASHKGRTQRRDNFHYLKHIKIPTLVIAGEKDFFFNPEDVRKVALEIEDAQFEIIEKSGHLPNMEKQQIFNKLITKFYQRIL